MSAQFGESRLRFGEIDLRTAGKIDEIVVLEHDDCVLAGADRLVDQRWILAGSTQLGQTSLSSRCSVTASRRIGTFSSKRAGFFSRLPATVSA